MNRNPLPDNISIEEQAEFWFGHIEAGDASQQDIEQFEAWLAQDKRHQDAFKQTAVLCQQIDELAELGQLEPMRKPDNVQRLFHFPKVALSAAAALVIAVLGISMLSNEVPVTDSTHYATAVAESREFTLDDGSLITLGAKSQVTVTFSDEKRQVNMPYGEAYFTVASDSERPFVIQAGNSEVEVIGTQFNINSTTSAFTVSVVEGQVSVRTPSLLTNTITKNSLTAGQQLHAVENREPVVTTVDPNKIAGWRTGHLVYENIPLSQLIADISRYKDKKISISSKELEALTVTATFGTDQVDQMLNGLPHLLPVQVVDLPGFILISAAKQPE